MSAITLGGDLVHYEVLGRGRPVYLVHGWIGSWRYWVPTMQQLQSKYRVYAIDLFGFGDSGKNESKYSLDHQVQMLLDFMKNMGQPKIALVGHGLGALVAIEIARRDPDSVPRLALVNPPLFDPGDLETRIPAGRPVALTDNRSAASGVPANEATIMNASSAMRAALLEASKARTQGELAAAAAQLAALENQVSNYSTPGTGNPLIEKIGGVDLEALLGRCFKRSEPEYDKLLVDVNKTDLKAVRQSIKNFDSGRLLDTVRLLPMTTIIIHGTDDVVMEQPSDDIWNYVTAEKDDTMLPIPLRGIRHFPMLEYERFPRLVNDFLDVPSLNELEIKERWRRRTR
ncbi:MAG: alpha/beta fold hydrolase [Anaerolineaceae bacterium]|nr:alpha/beta fold hydrolase [Anaerolineaceae bacterium]